MEKYNLAHFKIFKQEKSVNSNEDKVAFANLYDKIQVITKRCEKLSELISSKQVHSTDLIDPLVLGFSPNDIF